MEPKELTMPGLIEDPQVFSDKLFERMLQINPGIKELELYEFRYCLNNITPPQGWQRVDLPPAEEIEELVNQRAYYDGIQIKPWEQNRIVLDENIVLLTQRLFVGLATGDYHPEWVNFHFYFDIRGFFFLHRTVYFNEQILAHFGGKPYRQFARNQTWFDRNQDLGYKKFAEANADLDQSFIDSVKKIISHQAAPVLLAVAGPTAAGKTEIVARLRQAFEREGQNTTAIELDNFLTDRDQREAKGIHSQGTEALHLELLQESLEQISRGEKISIPRYDFIFATSSHNLDGSLKPDGIPLEIEPADIIFIEGNFPFLIQEVVHLIGIKVVYLTDDPIRLKRKWKRDIDYRKKYEPTYFRNRYFKSQFIMAEIAYRPQMEICDLLVDTTGGALWVSPEFSRILDHN
jgi:uridine kinase